MKEAKLQGTRQDLLWLLAEGTAAATGDEFFRSLARHAAEAMHAKYAFVAELVSECESRTLVFWEGGDYGVQFSYRVAGTPCQRVLAGQYCTASSGLQQMYPEDRLLVEMKAESYVGVPMITETGTVLGNIAVLHTQPMYPSDNDIAALIILAARACAELQRRRAEFHERALLEINNAIISSLSPDRLLQALGESLKRIMPFDLAALTVYEHDTDTLRLRAQHGQVNTTHLGVGQTADRTNSHIGWVFDHRQTLLRRSLGVERTFLTENWLFDEGIRSACTVPLLIADKCIGTVTIASRMAERYGQNDATFLESLGGQIALAVSNLLAFEEISSLKARLQDENTYLQEEIRAEHNFDEIVGGHRALTEVLRQVDQVAASDATVLITGETGTGKELIARAIHNRGARRTRPLVKVNCGAISAGLVESELFGHVKGAFTGALSRRIGRFELADGGSLFLDEVSELPMDTQVKLLRVLQEREFEPVGSSETRRVDVRVIAATNRNLADSVREGRFRADLYYRLNVIPLRVPALRERREDIPQLAAYFLERMAQKTGKAVTSITRGTMHRMLGYDWPGNVRELQNLIERGVVLASGALLSLDEQTFAGTQSVSRTPEPNLTTAGGSTDIDSHLTTAPCSLEEIERLHIVAVLGKTNWIIGGSNGAAEILKINPSTLRSRMKKLGIARTLAP
jgi:formate hydrogenlyase transcriptional activator